MDTNKYTCDQIIHIINQIQNDIWENEAPTTMDLNIRTLRYIISLIKQKFIEITYDNYEPSIKDNHIT